MQDDAEIATNHNGASNDPKAYADVKFAVKIACDASEEDADSPG
jgi:hypothetical protein